MKRRDCLAALAGILAMPSVGSAQQGRMHRIGFLGTALASGYVREIEWIRGGLHERGYIEGQNLRIEYRWAEGNPARLRPIAAEFVALKVDAIVTHAIPGAIAASAETGTIPIVMVDGGDPVAAGLATTVARPARNVTGSHSFTLEEIGKRLELLREVAPQLRRTGFLCSTVDPTLPAKRAALLAAAAEVKLQVHEVLVAEPADLPASFSGMEKARVDGLLVNNEPLLNSHAAVIAALATVKNLPSAGYASYADAGGLVAYGANRAALYGRAGYFLDRIFKGTPPGEIPFERAAKFDIALNNRTARALRLRLPESLRLRADRVIE